MGKIRKEWNKDLNQWVTWDEEEDVVEITSEIAKNLLKSGVYDKKSMYKYFCEHPDDIDDQKLFSELEEEFGNDN